MNVFYSIGKFESWGDDGKLEILVQEIKVKKLDFNLYFLINTSDRIFVCTA